MLIVEIKFKNIAVRWRIRTVKICFPLDKKKPAEINLISNKQFISHMGMGPVPVTVSYKLSINVPVKSHTSSYNGPTSLLKLNNIIIIDVNTKNIFYFKYDGNYRIIAILYFATDENELIFPTPITEYTL